MNLKDQVRKSLSWKKSDEIAAARLRMNLQTYKQLKQEIKKERKRSKKQSTPKPADPAPSVRFEEDLKNNEATLEYKGPKEIKTQEDIVRECNIDLEKWTITRMINNAWGKEGNQNYQVKVWLEPKKTTQAQIIEDILKNFNFKYTASAPVHLNSAFDDPTCAVLSLQDIHIGKKNVEDINDIVDSVKKCITNLILRSYHSCYLDKVIFVLGGDLLNVDTYNGTTTSGTAVENSMDALSMYREAFELMFWAINYIKQFCNELEVVYIPGNHDRLTSGQLAYSLSKVIVDPKIKWNIDYAERKVVVYGNSMIAVEHGDVTLSKSFFAFATEFPTQWGSTKFRTLYTGHYHKEKKVEYITTDEISGFTMKILPSLTRLDRYHQINKWTNNKRGGIIELHSKANGPTGQFSHYQ